jgi:hypothetical protein
MPFEAQPRSLGMPILEQQRDGNAASGEPGPLVEVEAAHAGASKAALKVLGPYDSKAGVRRTKMPQPDVRNVPIDPGVRLRASPSAKLDNEAGGPPACGLSRHKGLAKQGQRYLQAEASY